MNLKRLAWLAFAALFLGPPVFLLRLRHCERACGAALGEAESLAAAGALPRALARIDDADAACDCARFTGGDEPPEHAAIRVWVAELRAAGREDELRAVLAQARGPLLRAHQ